MAPVEVSDSLFRPGRRSDLLKLLGEYSANHVEATRLLAKTLGVHATDAVAVAEVLWAETAGEPLTPVRLGARIGLSSGATAALLNRLETSGHVRRSRRDADRRMVRLHLDEATAATTKAFFASSGSRLEEVLESYDDATLARLQELMTQVVAATAAHNAELASSTATGSGRLH